MRNRRVIVRLLAAAALLVGAHVVLSLREGDAARLLPRRTLVDDAFVVSDIVLRRPGAPAAVLRRTEDDWRLVAPYPSDVEVPVLQRFLDVFAFAPISDRVSDVELLRLGRTRADFGLERPRLSVVLSNDTGRVRFAFGAATPGGEGVYVAVEGVDSVFIVASNAFASVDRSVSDFRRRALVSAAASDVVAFDLKSGSSAPLRFVRTGEGWTLAGQERPAAVAPVRALLKGVFATEAVDFAWPVGGPEESRGVSQALLAGYGLDPESAVTATFKLADGTDRFVSFGKEAGEGLVYALAQGGGAIVRVPSALRAAAAADAAVFTDMRLFPYEASSVTSVSVADGEIRGLLARGSDGAWRLDAPVSAPADAAAAEAFVARILALKATDRDPAGPVVALGTNGAPVAVSRTALFGDLRLADLRARVVADVAVADIRRLVVTARDVRTSLVRDAEGGRWNLEGGDGKSVPDAAALAALLKALSPLEATRVVEVKVSVTDLPKYGLARPRLAVAVDLEQEDALRRNILIGDAVEDGAYATVGASDAVFVIPEAVVRVLAAPLVVPL